MIRINANTVSKFVNPVYNISGSKGCNTRGLARNMQVYSLALQNEQLQSNNLCMWLDLTAFFTQTSEN